MVVGQIIVIQQARQLVVLIQLEVHQVLPVATLLRFLMKAQEVHILGIVVQVVVHEAVPGRVQAAAIVEVAVIQVEVADDKLFC